MVQKTVLVVDDDRKIRALLRRSLEGEGFHVREAMDGAGVRAAFRDRIPDLVTLDLNLGQEDGLAIARTIRQRHDVPIIMVTGKDDVIDRIVGLELGADDYLTKPFHIREVLARVRSVLRRSEGRGRQDARDGEAPLAPVLELDGLVVDFDRMTLVLRDGAPCELTAADFKLLRAFLEHPQRPLSRDRLMYLVEGAQWTPLDRTIDNQVARLRKKIERDPARPRLIKTVRGIGYALTERAEPRRDRSSGAA